MTKNLFILDELTKLDNRGHSISKNIVSGGPVRGMVVSISASARKISYDSPSCMDQVSHLNKTMTILAEGRGETLSKYREIDRLTSDTMDKIKNGKISSTAEIGEDFVMFFHPTELFYIWK